MSAIVTASLLVESKCELAEGIQWNAEEQRLYWCDIMKGHLWSCDEAGGDVKCLELPDRIGSFAFDPNGDLLVAFVDGLYRMRNGSTDRELIEKFEADKPTTRFNDGRCDRQGRFVVGGIDEEATAPISQVVQYDGEAVKPLILDVGCTNSICFSPDGKTLYFADSPTREIRQYDYDPASGAIGERRTFVTLQPDQGVPDGSCIDSAGALWNARFGDPKVQRYLPDGTPDMHVNVPVTLLTCCCFGGPDLDRLYISSARVSLSDKDLLDQPQAGGIFVANPAVVGLPEVRFHKVLF